MSEDQTEPVLSFFGDVINYSCPHCGKPLQSCSSDVGKKDECPICLKNFVTPGSGLASSKKEFLIFVLFGIFLFYFKSPKTRAFSCILATTTGYGLDIETFLYVAARVVFWTFCHSIFGSICFLAIGIIGIQITYIFWAKYKFAQIEENLL